MIFGSKKYFFSLSSCVSVHAECIVSEYTVNVLLEIILTLIWRSRNIYYYYQC